jgi:hypothetical protein
MLRCTPPRAAVRRRAPRFHLCWWPSIRASAELPPPCELTSARGGYPIARVRARTYPAVPAALSRQPVMGFLLLLPVVALNIMGTIPPSNRATGRARFQHHNLPSTARIGAPADCHLAACWDTHMQWDQIVTPQTPATGPTAGQTVNYTILYKTSAAWHPELSRNDSRCKPPVVQPGCKLACPAPCPSCPTCPICDVPDWRLAGTWAADVKVSSLDSRCKVVGSTGNSVYCKIGKIVPDQLVAIVIVVVVSTGLPSIGVLGFEYTAFDQSLVSTGVTCGMGTTGGINLGEPKVQPPPPPPGFDQIVLYTWSKTVDTPEQHAPGTLAWINTTIGVSAGPPGPYPRSKLAATDTQIMKSLFWGAEIVSWTTSIPPGPAACQLVVIDSDKPTKPPTFDCRLGVIAIGANVTISVLAKIPESYGEILAPGTQISPTAIWGFVGWDRGAPAGSNSTPGTRCSDNLNHDCPSSIAGISITNVNATALKMDDDSAVVSSSEAGITFHNHSDCCCENIYPRSARNLVSSVAECVQNCAADAQCHAAVYLVTDVAGQCGIPRGHSGNKACCIHKKHFDGLSTGSPQGQVVIDMGTSTGPCPKPKPPHPPPPSPPKTRLARPIYHFTRCAGEMNDPNGLQWRHGPDGKPEFHMFFQAAGAGGCAAPAHGWGHTSGPDMVSWTRQPASGVCGSSGGGITLPDGFRGPNNEPWLSANIASAPVAGEHPAVGLHLFTTTDGSLRNYSRYQPKTNSTADPCVICPELVPAEVGAGYIGDNYVYQEPAFTVPSSNRTFYVLSGTNRCTNRSDL